MSLRAPVLALVVVALCLPGCRASRRRMMASGDPQGSLEQRGRLLAVGAEVQQGFAASDDGCIGRGAGSGSIRIDCIPNFGTAAIDAVTVDDATVVALSPVPPPANEPQAPVRAHHLTALREGRTVLRARTHVGLAARSFAIPLEVVVPDRVTVTGLEEPLFAGTGALRVQAFSRGREVETSGVKLVTVEGPAVLDDSGFHTVEDRGGTGVVRSPYDPSLAVPYTVVTERDLRATLEVLPGDGCTSRRVVPHFWAGAREVPAAKETSGERGLRPLLFVTTPKTCELDPHGTYEMPRSVGPSGAVVTSKGTDACTVQVGLRSVPPRNDSIVAMHEVRFAPGPCGAPR